MAVHYDAAHIAGFFDAYAEREWLRFEKSALDRAGLHLHLHYLKQFIEPGMRVLDAGAGPGRFTAELIRLGARVTVGDISPVQLEHNRRRLEEAGLEHGVESRQPLDITDLSRFADATFDAVLCYGGPISYVMDRADEAVAELLRVVKPGRRLLLSVMSKIGATRISLPGVLRLARLHGPQFIEEVVQTGLLSGEANHGHAMKMYTWSELQALIERHGGEVVAASASNHLTTFGGEGSEVVEDLWEGEPDLWRQLLDWEVRLCAEPGNLDGGTHIIAIVMRPAG
ncbi:MAG TPA: class I SAM-dependent methyltransferase [Trueperaceae bacterium]